MYHPIIGESLTPLRQADEFLDTAASLYPLQERLPGMREQVCKPYAGG